jgi:hypothetical protein
MHEEDQLHDNAIESNLPVSATPPPSPSLLLLKISSSRCATAWRCPFVAALGKIQLNFICEH